MLGLLPEGSPAVAVGTFIGNISDNKDDKSLVFGARTRICKAAGSIDVVEAFGEILLLVLADRPFFRQLTLGLAGQVQASSAVCHGARPLLKDTFLPADRPSRRLTKLGHCIHGSGQARNWIQAQTSTLRLLALRLAHRNSGQQSRAFWQDPIPASRAGRCIFPQAPAKP